MLNTFFYLKTPVGDQLFDTTATIQNSVQINIWYTFAYSLKKSILYIRQRITCVPPQGTKTRTLSNINSERSGIIIYISAE